MSAKTGEDQLLLQDADDLTDAARRDGAQLVNLVTGVNTGSGVWADTAYRSKASEQHLAERGFVS